MNPADATPTTETAMTESTSSQSAPVPAQLLADRVQRLEDAVALLTHHIQWDDLETTSQEPMARITHSPIRDYSEEKSAPRAMPIPPPPTASLAEFSLPPYVQPPPAVTASPLTNVLRPLQSALPLATTTVNRLLPASSIWRDLWWDLRTAWRMVRDPYYPMSTACKVVPLFALFYVTVWPWFSAWSGIVGTIMNYVVNAIVIYIAFKVIQRELRRYYEFAEKYRQ